MGGKALAARGDVRVQGEFRDLVGAGVLRAEGDGRGLLQLVEPPLEVPGYDMAMLWPERCHRDPAHQWLREFIVASL